MTSIKTIIKKQGGINLIKQYVRNGSFFVAIVELMMLGKNRTALEIIRLSAQLKTKQKLSKKYKSFLYKFDQMYKEDYEHLTSNKVWICWFQGIENAPQIVKKCYKSVKEKLCDRDIILITKENMHNYIEFPDYIIEKWNNGKITNTHMTDLLRLELLIKYGGMWLDATVLCSSEKIPSYITESELFFYQCLKPGRNGHCCYISSWLVSAKTNNKILMATRFLCYEYWKKSDKMIDYFLLHYFLSIALDYYIEDWNKVIPKDNSIPHVLYMKLFEKYDEDIWNAIKEQTPFHKLSYKFDESMTRIEDTYYKRLFNNIDDCS